MRVYPVPGLPLRDPVKGDFIPDDGREVADSPFWRRRLACKDASLSPPKTTPTSSQTALPVASLEVVADTVAEVLEALGTSEASSTTDGDSAFTSDGGDA